MQIGVEHEDAAALAIVGTRSPSAAADEFARQLGYEMAVRGLTIVSGLALGIDTAAHAGALETEMGRTLAVMGSGLRKIHPKQNLQMAADTMDNDTKRLWLLFFEFRFRQLATIAHVVVVRFGASAIAVFVIVILLFTVFGIFLAIVWIAGVS